jgi:hypothetical protein
MIDLFNVGKINTSSDEGKLLLAALAVLTSIDTIDIKNGEWGGSVHPDLALEKVIDLANRIFYDNEDYKNWKKTIDRDKQINELTKNPS